jgi:predicted ferric reductase
MATAFDRPPAPAPAPPAPFPPAAPRRLRPAPPWWADVIGAAAAGSLVVVTALWLSHHGVQDLGLAGVAPAQPADALIALGRWTGLVAADLLLIQVLLMARVPWIERSYGQDRLARWHRVLGFTSFFGMLAHVGFTTVGYAAGARTGIPAQFWELITTYPGMLLATAATGLLVLVAVTSMRAARRRLRYESFHLLHLYAYLAVGLALPHEIWTGTEFVGSPAARAYWWTLYGLTVAAVLVFRVGQPAVRTLRHGLRVAAVVPESPGVVSVHLTGRRLDRLPVRAGQFFTWRFLDGPGWTRAHPYSLSAAPDGRSLRITVKALGDGSTRLAAMRPGTRAVIEGPYGRLTGDVCRGRGVTLVGCGVGITPLRGLLEEVGPAEYGPVPHPPTVIFRASTPEDLMLRAELEALVAARGGRLVCLPGRRSADAENWLPAGYEHIRPEDALRSIDPAIAAHDVFVCGPPAWMRAVGDAARRAGVREAQIHRERFDW